MLELWDYGTDAALAEVKEVDMLKVAAIIFSGSPKAVQCFRSSLA